MIILRRSLERHHVQGSGHDVWLTFYRRDPSSLDPEPFKTLAALDELHLLPGGVSAPDPPEEAELLTYVYRGALAQEDSTGSSGLVTAGEFQHMTTGRGVRRKETNASRADRTIVFRVSLPPSQVGLDCAHEQQRFAAAQRRNVLCVVASPDGRKGSLRTLRDVVICSSILDPGHHLVHELRPARTGWLHVICGEATLQDIVLTPGDGVGVTDEASISFTAQERAEIFLVDLGPAPNRTNG